MTCRHPIMCPQNMTWLIQVPILTECQAWHLRLESPILFYPSILNSKSHLDQHACITFPSKPFQASSHPSNYPPWSMLHKSRMRSTNNSIIVLHLLALKGSHKILSMGWILGESRLKMGGDNYSIQLT